MEVAETPRHPTPPGASAVRYTADASTLRSCSLRFFALPSFVPHQILTIVRVGMERPLRDEPTGSSAMEPILAARSRLHPWSNVAISASRAASPWAIG